MEAVNPGDNRDGMTDEELRELLFKRRMEIQYAARLPANLVDIAAGEPAGRLGDLVRFSLRLPEWETRLTFTFTRERIAPRGVARVVEHLSIAFSVPQHLTKGEVRLITDQFLSQIAPLVTDWFPGREDVHAQLTPSEPVAVGNPETHQAVWRTPITAHFVVPIEADGVTDKRGF